MVTHYNKQTRKQKTECCFIASEAQSVPAAAQYFPVYCFLFLFRPHVFLRRLALTWLRRKKNASDSSNGWPCPGLPRLASLLAEAFEIKQERALLNKFWGFKLCNNKKPLKVASKQCIKILHLSNPECRQNSKFCKLQDNFEIEFHKSPTNHKYYDWSCSEFLLGILK